MVPITEALGRDGRLRPIVEALAERDRARADRLEEPLFCDPATGEELLARSGSYTPLVKRGAHFYHPGEMEERRIAQETLRTLTDLEMRIQANGNFVDCRKGLLEFNDLEMEYGLGSHRSFFNYGFDAVWAKHNSGEEYALVVFNRTPHSADYLALLKTLSDGRKSGSEKRIQNYVLAEGQRKRIGDKINLATVQVKNEHTYRRNTESEHPADCLLLGDWQLRHLLNIYGSRMAFYNLERGAIETYRFRQFPHSCGWSGARYRHKSKIMPREGPEFCQAARLEKSMETSFSLERFEAPKDSLAEALGSHPRFHLAQFTEQRQGCLF